ncbi:MAG: restriction endonuclease subunit S, partial [Candidatus Sedimenticola sp. (ex Thyasira tokunagai)]
MRVRDELPAGWRVERLENVAHIQTGIAKNKNSKEETVSLPYLRVANVQDGYLDLSEIKTIDLPSNKFSRYALKTGDVLLTEGGDFDKLGRGAVWRGQIEECVHQNHVFAVRPDQRELLPPFLSTLAGSFYGKKYFLRCSKQSTNLASINSSQLKAFPVLLPPLYEQQAITDLLATWDEVIEKMERLIQAKEKQKLAKLHSLITSQKANSTIASFATPLIRKVDKPEESYMALGIRSHFKGTFQRFVEDPKTVNMDSLYRVKENDLIVNITFAWEGAIALVKKEDEKCYVSHRFPTYEINSAKAEPCFIRQLIMSRRMKYELANISPGGAGRNRVLNRCQPWRAKRRLVIPGSREAALLTRRARSAPEGKQSRHPNTASSQWE